MREDYCFECGCYTRIDDLTKLCHPCFDYWRDGKRGTHALRDQDQARAHHMERNP
jgi:hypothetical protein